MAATQDGVVFAYGLGPGVNSQKSLTLPSMVQSDIGGGIFGVTGDTSQSSSVSGGMSTLWWLFGAVVLLIGVKFAVEHEKSPMQVHFASIGVYNYMVVGLMALLFIVPLKAILNKYPIKGLTQFVNAA